MSSEMTSERDQDGRALTEAKAQTQTKTGREGEETKISDELSSTREGRSEKGRDT